MCSLISVKEGVLFLLYIAAFAANRCASKHVNKIHKKVFPVFKKSPKIREDISTKSISPQM